MLIVVEQTKRNDLFSFQVMVDGVLTYTSAKSDPAFKSVPYINIFSKIRVTDMYGRVPFIAGWNYLSDLKNYIIPFKELLPGGKDMGAFHVMDGYGNPVGYFATHADGVFDNYKTIVYQNQVIHGFDVSHGRERSISFFINNDSFQIAELVKPLVVKDNMDYYYLYLKDEYSYLMPILMYFTIYFDLLYYPHAGENQKNFIQVDNLHTYSKANNYYDENWITNNFGPYAKSEMHARMDGLVVEAKANVARVFKLMKISTLILLPIIALIFVFTVLL